jgi:crossover junction endodeoxyribonuclease RusA
MNPLNLFVEGLPAPKGSWIVKHGYFIPDNREKLNIWTHAIKTAAKAAYSPAAPSQNAIELKLKFYLSPPRNTGQGPATTRPDIDKLSRAVMDALAGIVYADDRQVVRLEAIKEYSPNDSTGAEIEIKEAM